MIARVWKCIAIEENVAKYIAHFEHTVAPELKEIQGYHSATILRRPVNGGVEITVMTLWESMSAIHAFAGENVENAVVEPAAVAVLVSFDSTVMHYEVVLSEGQKY